MIISGLQKTTLLDYPNRVAATIFLGGCNMRCPFCQNYSLLEHPCCNFKPEEILAFLEKRKEILDGVCISGGEPTLHQELPEFLSQIKHLGYDIKLDSNGSKPQVLQSLIEQKLVDYVAMDVKGPLTSYSRFCGGDFTDTEAVSHSINLLKSNRIPYEFRTTVAKGLHSREDILALGNLLEHSQTLYLQNFIPSNDVPDKALQSFTLEELAQMKELLRPFIFHVHIRGE